MNPLVWDDSYSVFIRSIDNEHKILFSLVKEMEQALETQEMVRAQLVEASLKKLFQYIRLHFESEERYLLFNNYHDFTPHHEEHLNLLAELEEFEKKFRSERRIITEKMLLNLKDWLIRHIILSDCKYGNHFRKQEESSHC